MSAAARALRGHVSGLVQGVAFRWHARERALELGLAGWVRNLADGRVEVCFEGAAADVEAFRAWLGRGPRAAQVRGLALAAVEPAGWTGFEIVRDEPPLPS